MRESVPNAAWATPPGNVATRVLELLRGAANLPYPAAICYLANVLI